MFLFRIDINYFILDSFCYELLSIYNVDVFIEGFQIGNLVLYLCVEGYVVIGGLLIIVCNGMYWFQINFFCLGWFG